jgi:hypothetical protein
LQLQSIAFLAWMEPANFCTAAPLELFPIFYKIKTNVVQKACVKQRKGIKNDLLIRTLLPAWTCTFFAFCSNSHLYSPFDHLEEAWSCMPCSDILEYTTDQNFQVQYTKSSYYFVNFNLKYLATSSGWTKFVWLVEKPRSACYVDVHELKTK